MRRAHIAGLLLIVAAPGAGWAQRVIPDVIVSPTTTPAPAAWALPSHEERRVTIVAALPVPRRYRICNASNTTAVVTTDALPAGLNLPGRTCSDVAARTITILQRVAGIAPFGTYVELP